MTKRDIREVGKRLHDVTHVTSVARPGQGVVDYYPPVFRR